MQTDVTNVLVVDDEPRICTVVRDALEGQGFHCITTTDSHVAKQLLDDGLIRVMVSDIFMPEVTGLDLLAHVRQTFPECRVILITGISNTENLARALSLGAYDYFKKPFDVSLLIDAVTRAADRSATAPQLPIKAAEAMENAHRVRRTPFESVRALVHTVEAKDPYTRRHSDHVTQYATIIAELVGVSQPLSESIRVATMLHDIGKIGVPDSILTKPGPLTEAEFEHIHKHPKLGWEILKQISLFSDEAVLVRHHHERWDGGGYPDGISGEDIPLGARILNVADSIDAMLMPRTYKDAYPIEKMLAELVDCANTQFDPDLAALSVDWCKSYPADLILPSSRAA